MDESFCEMNCEFRSDSVVMRLLRAAMDKALKKVHSKDGLIERLIEVSKFYELALIQMESSLKLIQEEAGIPQSSREKLDSDLMEIQALLRGRLKKMKLSVVEMDRELMERLENELKLRQTLEMKERELAHLNSELELERNKNVGIQDFVLSNQARGDETKEGDICDLKNSVDQQVWNIKQKLEDERISLTGGTRKMDHMPSGFFDLKLDSELLDHGSKEVAFYEDELCNGINLPAYTLRPEQNIVIEQMNSDIDILKGTLDFAFGRMQNAEMLPLEKQWRWEIEQDNMLIVMKGFMRDHQKKFEVELRKRDNQVYVGFSNEHWDELINKMESLRLELKVFNIQNEVHVNRVKDSDNLASSPYVRRTSSEPLPEVDFTEELPEEDLEADRSHYVAKLIKNHESIIRKQQEKLDRVNKELSQGKGYLSGKRDKDLDAMERGIQKVIVELDNVMKWNNKLGKEKVIYEINDFEEKRKSMLDIADEDKTSLGYGENLKEEIRVLKQEIDYSNLKTLIMEETYNILLKGMMENNSLNLNNYVYGSFETEMREETRYTKWDEAVKDFGFNHGFTLMDQYEDVRAESITQTFASSDSLLQYLKSTIRDDVYEVYFKEMAEEWNKNMEIHANDNLAKEEICWIVVSETVKSIGSTANMALRQYQESRLLEDFRHDCPYTSKIKETIGSLLKEDVYMVFFREMIHAKEMERESYSIENLIREDIYQFVILEAVKDAYFSLKGIETLNGDILSHNLLYAKNVDLESNVIGEESLIQKPDSLLQKMEEDMMLMDNSYINSHSAQHVHRVLECGDLDEWETAHWLLPEDESSFSSVGKKLEKALEELTTSKALLRELENGLVVQGDDQTNPILNFGYDREQLYCQPKDNEVVQLNSFDSMFSPSTRFPQGLVDFECLAYKNLKTNCLRLDELKHQLNPIVQHVASLRRRELIYNKAFFIRCQNLQLAEAEVDMLGDQVHVLLGLLEEIYVMLEQYSPILSRYFEVSDMLKLIKKELTGSAVHT